MRSLLILALVQACAAQDAPTRLERIRACEARCSQGLQCRTKPPRYLTHCKQAAAGLDTSVFTNVSVATVMRCEGPRRCSLHLKVGAALTMTERVQGVSVCVVFAGVMERCRILAFSRAPPLGQLTGQQVAFHDDCFEVAASQDIHVTLKTVPEFCGSSVSRAYRVPGCRHEDLRSNVPQCITGRIAYRVGRERNELSVSVSDMLEDKDYNLRLCLQGYTCRGTGEHALLRKENPVKNVTFRFSRPLPCLCIEGWSSMTDAPRVQVCPFKNHMEELWSRISFDSMEQTLSWEAECHVNVVATLCQTLGDNGCKDLANSSQTANGGKVSYSTVDPHPQLCMKFTTRAGAWIKCPFTEGNFPVWDFEDGQEELVVTSRTRPVLSLDLCTRTGPNVCEEKNQATIVHVHELRAVVANLTTDLCGQNCCVQARRVDVKFSAKVLHCPFKCSALGEVRSVLRSSDQRVTTWVAVPGVALLTTVLVAASIAAASAGTCLLVRRRAQVRGRGALPPGQECKAAPWTPHGHPNPTDIHIKLSSGDSIKIQDMQQSENEKENLLSV
ncbi:putative interleukin-17 receptor E-like isoform X2 [Denticeps clupeoides]|uniref:Interleukin-17 receptor C/E N-terminal domain-containing protein n=1 Tax=Denticeps clupeoides TaxID=299321 RepID=A0AAY4DDK8_9TELE|nr:putative interleukin-17 receptor E-like isoform X2 [Denticeps clupeoides]